VFQGDWEKGFQKVINGVTKMILGPFAQLMPWVKAQSPHKFGKMWIQGFQKAEPFVEKSLLSPIEEAADQWNKLGKTEPAITNALNSSVNTAVDRLTDGFKKSQPAISKALISPINEAAAHASNIFSSTGRVSPVVGGMTTPPTVGEIKPIIPDRTNNRIVDRVAGNEEAIMRVVESINRLREDMLNGKIGANVRMDSQLVAETIKRSTEFRDGYGTNRAKA
jgi:hypothetical protein